MPPFMDEIQGFAEHMANQVNRRLLVLLSRILGMPDKFLWEKVSARGSAGDSLRGTSYHSHMGYHKHAYGPNDGHPAAQTKRSEHNSDGFGALSRRIDEGLEAPTYQEWKTVRSQGAQAKPEKTVDIDGVKYKEQMFNGTKLLMVV
ncbi:hypothetical protein CGLO_12383 [Colletotrichum gloeosporioides Cg-14]|uniref:Uncharacterized protein n=1 Tax=Colletotrichum gloeosporioides (strain Cg-14) TaxID=1237896 RepID=T0L9M7_COLGC|nr:hypothetical protein CGLO_12383 [Colletotrichum gloeosporioides Cg-14]